MTFELDRSLKLAYSSLKVPMKSHKELMMRMILVSIPLLIFLFVQNTTAGEVQVIELTDGSTITGEVLSLNNGVYVVKSESLGTVKLEESTVRAIHSKSSGTNASVAQQTRAIQDKMMNDKEIMGLIQSLQNDPEFKKILENPEIMKAVNEGNISALTSNPQFMNLLNNATVKDIQQKAQ